LIYINKYHADVFDILTAEPRLRGLERY